MEKRRRETTSDDSDESKRVKRSRDGCLNCRRRKKKCSGRKPQCEICERLGETCSWQQPLRFRAENAFTMDDSPRPRNDDLSNGRNGGTHTRGGSGKSSQSSRVIKDTSGVTRTQPAESSQAVLDPAPAMTTTPSSESVFHAQSEAIGDNNQVGNRQDSGSLQDAESAPSRLIRSNELSEHGPNTPSALSDFANGMVMSPPESVPYRSPLQMVANTTISPTFSPEALRNDGIFLPGSEYQEFHNLLRAGMLNTGVGYSVPPVEQPQSKPVEDGANEFQVSGIELTKQLECELWQNWLIEISAWLDKFDSHKHFRHTLPVMAKSYPHLRYSILALSARQLEMKHGSPPASISLGLYQEAIHSVLPEMETRNTAVVASCVVLCVLEMFSCSPKAWRRHLDGCASLIQSMDIRGDSGGVEQALFWCFARMDVCGGLISSERPLIPVDRWTSNADFETDTIYFLEEGEFEKHANYVCYLLARALDLFARCGMTSDPTTPKSALELRSYPERWMALFDRLDDWYMKRPAELEAVASLPSDLSQASNNPFDTLIFSNGAAISGNQLYHTAVLLMLQKKPQTIVKRSRSILWHARKVCAITLSNPHHGCWTNCIQPLWIAGQLMSHPSEHKAIVNMFKRIEDETGWGATWRARDLEAHWGDLSC